VVGLPHGARRCVPLAASALSGAIPKQRGVKPGVPDVPVWYCGKSITIELKSRQMS